MSSDERHRRVSWTEHLYGRTAPPPRRAARLAFRDAVVEATLRLQGVPRFHPVLKRWLGSAKWEAWKARYEARCMRYSREFERVARHRAPAGLEATDLPVRRALVLGSCLSEAWIETFQTMPGGFPCDYVLINGLAELPSAPPRPADQYDLQIVQLASRSLLPETSYFRLPYADVEAHRQLFEGARERLPHYLANMMRWNEDHGLLTFVTNFFVPQQNPMGRLMPRQDPRNLVYLVERINALLAEEIERYKNAYLLDIDQIAATFGKAFIQDDSLRFSTHTFVLDDEFWLSERGPSAEYPSLSDDLFKVPLGVFISAVGAEIMAMYRTVRQVDAVKLVVVDLDDTVWRGIAAEGDAEECVDRVEGWPLGVIEALHFLKKRGVLLAVISKNDEARIAQLWDQATSGQLSLDDFAVRRINWHPKTDNLEEVMREVNVLPRSVVFVDDNPVERAAVVAAFPDVRVLGAELFRVRPTLLWAAELQVAGVTAESAGRTEMVKAQIEREADRRRMSRGDFLASLGVKVTMIEIAGVEHPKFGRAFELINKTNQFNTTGRRWTRPDCERAFAERGQRCAFHAFEVRDRFTRYGLVGVAVTKGSTIEQFVMSCRVFGLDVEKAVIAHVARRLNGVGDIVAHLQATDANFPCRDLYERCGFDAEGNRWIKRADHRIEAPAHVELV